MSRQRNLDTPPTRCFYTHRVNERPHCQLVATVRYGPIALCPDCDRRRSAIGKGTPPQPLPTHPPVDILAWTSQANQHLQQAHAELTAIIWRARAAGHPWSAIGQRLGITRQAAQQRFNQDPNGGA